MIGVVLRIFPVDIVDVKTLRITINRLRLAGAQAEQVVDLLVLIGRAGGAEIFQRLHRRLNRVFRKSVGAALKVESAGIANMIQQDRFEQGDAQSMAPQLRTLLRAQIVPAHIDQQLQCGQL